MPEEFTPQPVKGPDEQLENSPEFPDLPISDDLKPPSFWQKVKSFYSNNKWYVWAIIVGIIIIGVLSAIAFWPRDKERAEEAKVSVSIDAPTTAQAGGEVIYKIKILNQDPAKLVDMNLELVYADGVSYVNSQPPADNLSGTAFAVPDLANGDNVALIIKTLAQGDVNDTKRLVARLHYSFDNFNSAFTIEQTHELRLIAADVLIDITGPSTSNNSEVSAYKINYRNNSKKDVENGRIQVTFPDGFSFAESKPEPSRGQNIWNIGTLEPGDKGEISFQGSFKGADSGRSYEFIVEFLVLDKDSNFYTQSSTSFTTTIESRPLNIDQRILNSSSEKIVNPGDQITVELTFQNNTQIVNTGVQLTAEVNSDSVDFGSLKSESGFTSDGSIKWNASGVNILERLNPGEKSTVKYSFKVKNPATNISKENIEVTLKAKIKSNENPNFIPGGDLILKVSSPVSVRTGVEHSGGALPPVVGVTSAFTITIDLENSSNAMREGVLIGYVPTGIKLDPSTFSNTENNLAAFDAATGKVTWQFGQLIAHAGKTKLPRTLSFTVTSTPTAGMLGRTIDLFKDIKLTAVDNFTSKPVSVGASNVGTDNLTGGSSNDGRVQN